MIIVDTALAQRESENNPIRVALVGAGFSARHIAAQITRSFPSIHLVVIANRTLQHAKDIFTKVGIDEFHVATTSSDIAGIINSSDVKRKHYCVTDNIELLFATEEIDAIIETSGHADFGAWVALNSIQSGKHTFVLNCETDATVGPMLKVYAEKHNVIYSNTDGDEPGVANNLSRHVRTMGLEVVGAGNLKGFYDPYRTPETQKGFAEANNQKPVMVTSFVDGTKLSMELTVLANALGFGVAKRGMHGVDCEDVRECLSSFPEGTFTPGNGTVDFLIGASPYTGAFVIGHTTDAMKQDYLKYLKMGDGPNYVFYTPFHLPQFEIPITVARGVLLNDAAVTPKDKPYCDAIAVAKKDLLAGETLDGIGGYGCYTLIDNYTTCRNENLLPMGVSEGCVLTKNIAKDQAISYSDVILPEGRTIDQLRNEMVAHFA